MTAYTFAPLPSNSSVATLVTFVVSAWFLVACAAMYTGESKGPASESLQASAPAAQHTRVAPEARFTITVVAKRVSPVVTL